MQDTINFPQFKRLLETLENSEISIRLRISGESWLPYSRLILLSESAMILQDGPERKMITNLRNIVEFEIDKKILTLEAHCPYEISY
ncbi:MAG TPA: hypothetical protein VIQ51_14565 [Chryseosolibacter sp.]